MESVTTTKSNRTITNSAGRSQTQSHRPGGLAGLLLNRSSTPAGQVLPPAAAPPLMALPGQQPSKRQNEVSAADARSASKKSSRRASFFAKLKK